MKKNDLAKLKTASRNELLKSASDAKEELRKLKFELAAGKVKNIGAVRELRKNIARMITFAKLKTHDNK